MSGVSHGDMDPDCVFGKEDKVGQVSRKEAPLTKSLSVQRTIS